MSVNSTETYVLESCAACGTLLIVLIFHRNSLETPTLSYSGRICIRFFYLMKGYWMGNLFVFVSSLGEHNYVFIHRDNIDDKWHAVGVSTTVSREDKVRKYAGSVGWRESTFWSNWNLTNNPSNNFKTLHKKNYFGFFKVYCLFASGSYQQCVFQALSTSAAPTYLHIFQTCSQSVSVQHIFAHVFTVEKF